MNRIITLFIGLLLTTLSFAQNKVDFDNDSRWFWGVNVGVTWSKADVTKQNDWGWGLTLGKSFNYNYGRAFSFDLRGRYLTGEWYGQNGDTTGFQYGNTALSSGVTDYQSAYGYSVLNFQSKVHELSLELVIHANSLRAKTGWDPYIFGGVGYTWYRTKGDLIDSRVNGLYQYDSLVANNNVSVTSASNLLDEDYETALDGSKLDTYTGAFMPSLGFGLGYQIGPRFSIGLEHKTTFTLADNFDGSVNPTGKYENDWYHYTSAYMRFQIRDHATIVETPQDNSLNNVNNYDQAQNNLPPTVDFTNPSVSGTIVNSANYVIRATIKNVPGSNNVIFRQNGIYNTNFTFNPSTQAFESIVTLNPGQNVFELTGTNNYGSDQEQTIIIYNREQQNPPVVTYVNPGSSPTTVQNPAFNLSATVVNVSQQNQITMTLNGQPVTNFVFTASNHVVTANLNLVVGTNIITTTGTNQYGSDQESTTLIYNPVQTEQPPVVYFVDPNVNPYTTTSPNFTINADVLNVAGAQNITFKQNGSVNQNFLYNAQTDDFQSAVVLNPGQNVFEIIGSNSAGTAQASTIIIYNRAAPKPPIVTFTNPATNPQEVNNPIFNLAATVLNVTQSNQITVKLNGQLVTNFTYNNSNNSVFATLNLIQGSNVVVVTGTNSDGTDSKQTTIIYRPTEVVQPPVVQFTAPNVNPYTTDQASFNVMASVLNVANISGVNVNVNGQNITNFSFINSTVTLPLILIEGANSIIITGTNTAGTDSESQTIIYRKPATILPPVVTFIDPSVNPTTVYNGTYNVKSRVRYVTGANQIVLRINGQTTSNFTYSSSSEIMDFTTALVVGANVVEITATNAAGQDQESTTIIYRLPNPTVPPVVTITNPISNPYTSGTITTPIAATVLNVDGAQNIQVTLNSVPFTNFTYNTTTKQVNFSVNLNSGSNTISILATNSAGQASDNRTIIYTREQAPLPPFVTFIYPATSGTVVNTAGITMKAHINNVTQASQVVVMEDGQVISPALWSFDPASKDITFNTSLGAGNNVFTVTGTNTAGTHSATTNITYQAPIVVCDKPVISITNPANAGTQVAVNQLNVVATIQNVNSANQIQVRLNGVLQSIGNFVQANGMFTKGVLLVEGQNSIEMTATNSCGETKSVTTIIYRPVAAPCFAPTLQRVDPISNDIVVEVPTATIKAAVANVASGSDITVFVNNVAVTASYDGASHLVTATVNLNEGINQIRIVATTSCGTSNVEWKITRKVCTPPTITLTSSSVQNGSSVFVESVNMVLAVSGVQNESEITVVQNGQNVGFVYNAQTNIITLDRPLVMGVNSFSIKVQNACGQNTYKFAVTRRPVVSQGPPNIQITNPPNSPYNISQAGMTVNLSTANVTAANQVLITVNGIQTNFNFNSTNGSITFDANFQVGSNVIVATAVTPAGTDTETKTVIYTAPVVVQKPLITLTNPTSCPALLPRGPQTISGTITNISNHDQVSILFNNANVNFNGTITNNVMSFSFIINVVPSTVALPIVITATNEGGMDTETCAVSIFNAGTTEGGGTAPTNPTTPTTNPSNPTAPTNPNTPNVRPGTLTPKPTIKNPGSTTTTTPGQSNGGTIKPVPKRP